MYIACHARNALTKFICPASTASNNKQMYRDMHELISYVPAAHCSLNLHKRLLSAGSNQLQSLSSFGFTQPLAPRKRRGPLYARSSITTGAVSNEVSTSQMTSYSEASENKGLQQQSQWQTLGNGLFGDRVTSLPPTRNGFSQNGLHSLVFPGMQGQEGSGNGPQVQSQAFANGLPANGSLFAHSSS